MTANGTFVFTCSSCGYRARMPSTYAGRTVACPGCQAQQVAVAPAEPEQRKTASILRVAATPVPFTLPAEQEAALAAAAPPPRAAMTTPLPGAVQITTDRVTRQAPAAKETVDFTCLSCKARLRLPGHYAGKSILCPKCNEPQKVIPVVMPMDTTRSLAQRAEEAPKPAQPLTSRTVRVTPLPRTYTTPLPNPIANSFPTPLPMAAPAPAGALTPLGSPTAPAATPVPGTASWKNAPAAVVAPAAAPVTATAAGSGTGGWRAPAQAAPVTKPATGGWTAPAESTPAPVPAAAAPASEEAPVDEELGVAAVTTSKPHPSKSRKTTASFNRQITPVEPTTPVPAPHAAKTPTGLLIAIGVLGIATIAFGAGMVYHLLALDHVRERLAEAELAKKTATERETATEAQLKELEGKLRELEAKLSAAETTKPAEAAKPTEAKAPEAAPEAKAPEAKAPEAKAPDAKPLDAPPAEPAAVKPADPAPAPAPAPAATP